VKVSAWLDDLKKQIAKELEDAKKIPWPTMKEIIEQAKHEDSDGYFGFIAGCEWMRAYVEGKKKA